MYLQKARGIRKSSLVVVIAAPATPENLFLQSAAGTNPRTVIVRKVMAYNNTGALQTIDIGVGLAPLVNIIPTLACPNAVDSEWTEAEIPEVEVNANITVQCSAAAVQVQVEVEEIE